MKPGRERSRGKISNECWQGNGAHSECSGCDCYCHKTGARMEKIISNCFACGKPITLSMRRIQRIIENSESFKVPINWHEKCYGEIQPSEREAGRSKQERKQ